MIVRTVRDNLCSLLWSLQQAMHCFLISLWITHVKSSDCDMKLGMKAVPLPPQGRLTSRPVVTL